MKYFTFIFIGLAIILMAYNVTFLDFSNLIDGQSGVALIGIVCAACAVLLMLILYTSKKIAKKKRH
jgi:divalent metal cation (Fe/Co/Zn/Cd) transporter